MKLPWPVVAAGGLAIGAVVGFVFSQRVIEPRANAADSTKVTQPEREVLYWHDPMVPGQKFDKPGKSPFMDMDLVPVYADASSNDAGVKVASGVTQSLGIRLGKAEISLAQPSLTAVGSVAFDEHRVQLIQARVDGYVRRLYLKATLDRVRKGQVLAEITAPHWQEALQEYAALLQSDSPRAHEVALAARARLQVLDVPTAAIEAVTRTRQVEPSVAVRAPIDGVVTELGVREGAAFAVGATLFRITGLESVWVNAQIPEAQLAAVAAGASVAARATAWPGETFEGRVQAVLPDVDAATRTLTVRIGVDNARGKLAPGMFVSLDIRQPAGERRLTVPSEAVIVTGQRSVVIVATASGGFKPVEVVTGGQVNDRTIVLQGLQEGQDIVLSGQFLLDSEASVKSTVERLSEDAPANAAPAALPGRQP